MFLSNLDTRQVGIWQKRTVHQVLSPLIFSAWGCIGGIVPAKFYTDFASVPRHFGLYETFGGRCNKEAVPHDYMYRKGSELLIDREAYKLYRDFPECIQEWVESGNLTVPKDVADSVFLRLMEEEGEDPILHHCMYEAVHMWGNGSFNRFEVMDPLPCDKWDVVIGGCVIS